MLVFKNNNNLSRLFSKIKDSDDKFHRSNLIYQIPCENCDGVYIGQTNQLLKNRITGHKSNDKPTALTEHMIVYDHRFNFPETKILDYERVKKKREFLEMIYIAKNKNSVNKRRDIDGLSRIYKSVLQL